MLLVKTISFVFYELRKGDCALLFICDVRTPTDFVFFILCIVNNQFTSQRTKCTKFFLLNVYVTLQHRRFWHVSIHNEIIIREHESDNTAWSTVDFCTYSHHVLRVTFTCTLIIITLHPNNVWKNAGHFISSCNLQLRHAYTWPAFKCSSPKQFIS